MYNFNPGLGPRQGGNTPTYDISTATVVRNGAFTLYTISIITAGSAAGAAYDNNATTGNSAANQIAVIPNVAGMIVQIAWPCATGITIVPGSGQVVAVTTG